MGKEVKTNFDLEATLLKVLRKEATPAEQERLNQALRGSEELRAQASRFLARESLIKGIVSAGEWAASLSVASLGQGRLRPAPDRARPRGRVRGVLEYLNQHGLAISAIAATIIIALLVERYVAKTEVDRLHSIAMVEPVGEGGSAIIPARDPLIKEQGSQTEAPLIGRISGLDNVVWAPGQSPVAFGDKIRQGHVLDIEEGVVELLLTTGAKVTIEGPAHFTTDSVTESTLSRGRIAAAAPRTARGYTVMTPTSELVDIGTQFGVLVEETGDSELHVFDGDVVARSLLTQARPDLIHAVQNEAMRFTTSSPTPERFLARQDDFVRELAHRQNESELPALPSSNELAAWYTADTCGDLEVGSKLATWRDLLIGDNDFADDAWQFDAERCPSFVRDDLGRAAIRFDGWSTSLATSPMQVSDQRTTFLICSPAPLSYANDDQGSTLIRFGDAVGCELTIQRDLSARGMLWSGTDSSNVRLVQSKPLTRSALSMLAFTYNVDRNEADLWLNGTHQGTSPVPGRLQQSARMYIGSQHDPNARSEFFGTLYEIAVFDRAMSGDEISQFWEYFQQRYQIAAGP